MTNGARPDAVPPPLSAARAVRRASRVQGRRECWPISPAMRGDRPACGKPANRASSGRANRRVRRVGSRAMGRAGSSPVPPPETRIGRRALSLRFSRVEAIALNHVRQNRIAIEQANYQTRPALVAADPSGFALHAVVFRERGRRAPRCRFAFRREHASPLWLLFLSLPSGRRGGVLGLSGLPRSSAEYRASGRGKGRDSLRLAREPCRRERRRCRLSCVFCVRARGQASAA